MNDMNIEIEKDYNSNLELLYTGLKFDDDIKLNRDSSNQLDELYRDGLDNLFYFSFNDDLKQEYDNYMGEGFSIQFNDKQYVIALDEFEKPDIEYTGPGIYIDGQFETMTYDDVDDIQEATFVFGNKPTKKMIEDFIKIIDSKL